MSVAVVAFALWGRTGWPLINQSISINLFVNTSACQRVTTFMS